MKPRNLLTVLVVAAIVVIGGFAAADAIRGNPRVEPRAAPTVPVQTTPTRIPGPDRPSAPPPNWPQGLVRGALTFTDRDSCRIRVVDLGNGRERPVARFGSECSLWAPPVGSRVAYGLGPSSADGFQPFRLADIEHPDAELGGYRAFFGVVVWSADGERVGWCGRRHTGFDLEIGGAARRVHDCPVAYTPDDQVVTATGNRLMLDGRAILHVDGGITYAHFGDDGSIVVVIDGTRIERLVDGVPVTEITLPAELEGKTPILRWDNCGALFRTGNHGIRLLDLGCRPGLPNRSFLGDDAAWSPDGRWVAVAQPQQIALERVVGSRLELHWPAGAAELVWRPGS